ncbi:MAG: DUF4214 domain-containing protein [Pyrinomonadaceae bacterium]
MSRRAFFGETTVFLGFLVLTAIMTWPWILHLRDAVADHGDSYAHAYWLWWGAHQTFHDPLNLFNATIFFPYKNTLAFSENDYGIALLFSPLHALGFRPVTILSVATLIAYAFSGYGMFRLTRTLIGSKSSAWLAGIIFAFLPYHFQRLPHLPLIFAGWIPLLIEALVLFARQRSWQRATWLGVAFIMNALTCVTWFILTLLPFGLSAAFLLVWCRSGRDRAFWIRGGVALGVAVLALLCFMFPYYQVSKAYGFARSAGDAMDLSAYPIHWLAVSPRNKLWNGLGGNATIDELTLFPGLLPPLLALAAFLLVTPVSRQDRNLKLPKIRLYIPRRKLLVLLDVLTFTFLLTSLLTIGYGGIHFRLFGFELLRSTQPIRPLIFAITTICVRLLVAFPEIIHRIIREKNIVGTFRSNPYSVAFGLGLIWGVTGLLGSFGMHFFFHRILFEFVPFFKSMRTPVRWAMICYVGLSILAGLGAMQVAKSIARRRAHVPRALVPVSLAMLILFEQRVAPIEFFHGEVDPDALTLHLKETPMSGGIVELPAERDNYAYFRYMLRAADHGRPIVTASSSFAPPIVQEIESLTLTRPIPDRFIDLLEKIPASYLVVHNSLLSTQSRDAIQSVLARGIAGGRIRFINSYVDSTSGDNAIASGDLYAITKIEPNTHTEAPNPIDDALFFVRQQYLDVTYREPTPTESDTLVAFINSCQGEQHCLTDHRVLGALDRFHSNEFVETSLFIYLIYKLAFNRMPKYVEWEHDIAQFGQNSQEARLTFVRRWAHTKDFLDQYPEALTNADYVDKLLKTSYRPLNKAEQKALIDSLNNGKATRAEVLLKVKDSLLVAKSEYNEALVAISYFNYLKRDPDPDGYNHWLQILRTKSNGETAVIKGFIYSGEYRSRFGHS